MRLSITLQEVTAYVAIFAKIEASDSFLTKGLTSKSKAKFARIFADMRAIKGNASYKPSPAELNKRYSDDDGYASTYFEDDYTLVINYNVEKSVAILAVIEDNVDVLTGIAITIFGLVKTMAGLFTKIGESVNTIMNSK